MLNISDIMVIESALCDLIRRANADISTLPADSILREILEKDSARANRLSGGLNGGVAQSAPKALPIKPARENMATVLGANTNGGKVAGDEMVSIDSLTGGAANSTRGQSAVDDIAAKMSGPDGFIERLIVDQDGNVVEGAHRLDALRKLGIKDVPITRIVDPTANVDVLPIEAAIRSAGPLHSDHVNQIVSQVGEMLSEVGGDPSKILSEFELPKGFEKHFKAAIDSLPQQPLQKERARASAEANKEARKER